MQGKNMKYMHLNRQKRFMENAYYHKLYGFLNILVLKYTYLLMPFFHELLKYLHILGTWQELNIQHHRVTEKNSAERLFTKMWGRMESQTNLALCCSGLPKKGVFPPLGL